MSGEVSGIVTGVAERQDRTKVGLVDAAARITGDQDNSEAPNNPLTSFSCRDHIFHTSYRCSDK
jgi:hypothetical protein